MDTLLIDPIHIIIEKCEPQPFAFRNARRPWDGFVLITDGSGQYWDRGGAPHPIVPGSLMLLRRDDDYRMQVPAPCAYITSAFDFAPQCAAVLAPLPPVVQCSDLQIRWIHAAAAQWALQNWDSAIQCQILLLQLYRSLLQTAPSGGQPSDPIAAHAAAFIHRRFKTAFSIDALAQECAVSPSYLRARFRQSMGCSILEYRDRLRINAAREMLQSGFFSVGEVAAALGYCDVYHFSRVFTAHVHCPPGKFRRAAR